MKCFWIKILTAIAVLSTASTVAADNLPPVPKTIPVTVSAIIMEKADPPKVESAPANVERPSCEKAPMPPVPARSALAEAKRDVESQARTCRHALSATVTFVANECLRKPIHDVRKLLNDLKGRRLCNENCRLNHEADRLAVKRARWECKQADHQQRMENLKANRVELFGCDE